VRLVPGVLDDELLAPRAGDGVPIALVAPADRPDVLVVAEERVLRVGEDGHLPGQGVEASLHEEVGRAVVLDERAGLLHGALSARTRRKSRRCRRLVSRKTTRWNGTEARSPASSRTITKSSQREPGGTAGRSGGGTGRARLVTSPSRPVILEVPCAAEADGTTVARRAEGARSRRRPSIASADLSLELDLLNLRRDAKGNPKPESPSALETLMVSPLGWLLQRLHAEPTFWVPEEANVLLLGTLSHTVFEHTFRAGAEVPDRAELPGLVRSSLDAAIADEAPFMQSALWRVDRRQLESELVQAAETWREVLIALNAKVIGNEVWLQGDLHGLSIHGQADALLELPNGRLLIVDFKKSSSASRRKRMYKGYDSQVELYRQMITTGGVKEDVQAALGKRLQAAGSIGVVYYTLNDQVSLSDMTVSGASGVPGWETLADDVANEAMKLIDRRVEALRAGQIRMNRLTEIDSFEKESGIKPYALEISPLVTLFMRAGEAEDL